MYVTAHLTDIGVVNNIDKYMFFQFELNFNAKIEAMFADLKTFDAEEYVDRVINRAKVAELKEREVCT